MEQDIKLTTLENIPSSDIDEYFGIISASAIHSIGGFAAIKKTFKHFFGGEVSQVDELFDSARQTALSRLKEEGVKLGANAIVAVKFECVYITSSICEVYVYGSAVKITSF